MITLTLPWPPSVNHYWRSVQGRVLISREGRAYRETVAEAALVRRVKALTGRLELHIQAVPPDRRRRDLDNVLKSLLDALQHAGCYEDDSQIDRLSIERQPRPEAPGQVRVTVQEMGGRNGVAP